MNEVAIVTGGAGALGMAVTRELHQRGFRVGIVDSPAAESRAKALAAELSGAHAFAGDVGSAAGWSALTPAIRAALGTPTLAVLVAGAWRGGRPVHELTDDDDWQTMVSANLETVYRSFRALLPGMVENKRGSVVVIGSRAAVLPATSAGAAAYAASKAAVVALAQATAAEVLPHGVRINAVLPSTLDTPANRAAMPKVDPSRWVTTESAAQTIAFLLSDQARDVSGAAIPVYGHA